MGNTHFYSILFSTPTPISNIHLFPFPKILLFSHENLQRPQFHVILLLSAVTNTYINDFILISNPPWIPRCLSREEWGETLRNWNMCATWTIIKMSGRRWCGSTLRMRRGHLFCIGLYMYRTSGIIGSWKILLPLWEATIISISGHPLRCAYGVHNLVYEVQSKIIIQGYQVSDFTGNLFPQKLNKALTMRANITVIQYNLKGSIGSGVNLVSSFSLISICANFHLLTLSIAASSCRFFCGITLKYRVWYANQDTVASATIPLTIC